MSIYIYIYIILFLKNPKSFKCKSKVKFHFYDHCKFFKIYEHFNFYLWSFLHERLYLTSLQKEFF